MAALNEIFPTSLILIIQEYIGLLDRPIPRFRNYHSLLPRALTIWKDKVLIGNDRMMGIFSREEGVLLSRITKATSSQGIAVINNHIFIADNSNARLQVFSTLGRNELVDEWRLPFPRPFHPLRIAEISNQIVTTDSLGCLHFFSSTGDFLFSRMISRKSINLGGLAIINDKIVVVNRTDRCLQILSSSGEFIASWDLGKKVIGDIAAFGNYLIVADDGDRLRIFSEERKLICLQRLGFPISGIATDGNTIILVDCDSCRCLMYHLA